MFSRRVYASLIRARQEVQKRIDVVWMPEAPANVTAGLPQLQVPDPSRPGLPSGVRSAILGEAEEVRSGLWRIFGNAPLRLTDPVPWRTNPSTGLLTPLVHWSRLSYLDGQHGDVKEVWELNRHRGLLRLAQAWHFERDAEWLEPLARHLDSWIAQNPAGLGINWASSLEVGIRALAWVWIRNLTRDAPIWTPARHRAFAESLWHHGRHIARYDSVHHSPNTHLTGEGLALAILGRACPDWPGARGWVALGDRILCEELHHQILPDGMHAELAPGYHRYTVEFYLLWLAILQQAGERLPPKTVCATVLRMVETLAVLRRPDGRLPGIGDEDGGVTLPLGVGHPRDPDPVVGLAAGILGAGEWWASHFASESLDFAWWILDDAAWQKLTPVTAPPLQRRVLSLQASGYHVLRETHGDGWWCLVDAGPQATTLQGHTHCDLGHVEAQWARQAVISDPGSLSYSPDRARRDSDRSAVSHATLTVEEAPVAESAGPFRWARLSPTPHSAVSSHDEWALVGLSYSWVARDGTPLRHERQTALIDEFGMIVMDRLSGAAGRVLTLTWPMPIPPTDIRLVDDGAILPGGLRLCWTGAGVSRWAPRLKAWEFADTYRTPILGTFLQFTGQATDEVLLVSWFATPGQPSRVSLVGTAVRIERAGRGPLEFRGGMA